MDLVVVAPFLDAELLGIIVPSPVIVIIEPDVPGYIERGARTCAALQEISTVIPDGKLDVSPIGSPGGERPHQPDRNARIADDSPIVLSLGIQ